MNKRGRIPKKVLNMKPKQKHQEDDKDGNENERIMMSNWTKEEHDLW